MIMTFVIMGEPVAQGRPRFAHVNGHAIAYDPPKSKDYKNYVKMVTREAMATQHWQYTEEMPLRIRLSIYLPVPKSKPRKFKLDAIAGKLFPTKKPDMDNIYKCVTDAMSKVAYGDDKQIVMATLMKSYTDGAPYVKVSLSTMMYGSKDT